MLLLRILLTKNVANYRRILMFKRATTNAFDEFQSTPNRVNSAFYSNCKHCTVLRRDTLLKSSSRRWFSQEGIGNPDLGKLLYVGEIKNRLKWSLGTFYILSGVVASSAPYLLSLASNSVLGTIFMGMHIFIFVILNPVGLYQFGKRYVNQLYYNKDKETYTAITLSPLIIKDRRLSFTAKECQMPANPSVFTSFYVKTHPLFINSDEMSYNDYMKMLRFASDFDYENPDRQEQYSEAISDAVEAKQKEQKK